uniref:Apple domain-containing protein n=1 Tax=Kalmanozyma brasiliensis (strain GHG001) TaxID=1365824 RepID=V5E3Q3_KALBG
MWADAFARHPSADWYIGYEADTYVLWPSLFRFLSTQDPTKEQIFGCASILVANQEVFANGGCPYVISGALMRATYGKDPHFAQRFEDDVVNSCCGDAELSIALRKSATVPIKRLGDAGARFNGERPREVLFEEGNWCTPVLSFHHVTSEEVNWLSGVEREIRTRSNGTVLYSSFFDYVTPPELKLALDVIENARNASGVDLNPTLDKWEAFSGSDHHVKQASRANGAEGCKKQCLESGECTSWVWSKADQDADGECHTMHDGVRVGKEYKGTGTRTSGWIAKEVASFKSRHACKAPPSA